MEKEHITRMNFLAQGHKGLTYTTMLRLFIAWCLFLVSIYAFMIVRQYMIRHEMDDSKEFIESLNVEKEAELKRIQQLSRRRVGVSAKHGLASIIENRPIWSKVIVALTTNLPTQVWLDSVKVIKDAQDERLEILGKAKSQRALTNFVMRIEASDVFSQTSLVSTTLLDKETGLLRYEISTRPLFYGL